MQNDKIQEALVDLLYRQSYGVLFVNFVLPLPVVYIFRHAVPAGWLLAWIGAVYLLTAGRIILARRYARRTDGADSALRWGWRSAAFSWVSGLLWGLFGWMGFLSAEPHLLSFTVIMLTGLVCGSITSLSAFPPALVGSLVATLLPVTIRCLTGDGEIYNVYLFLVICLASLTLYYGRVTNRSLTETVRLRSENVTLIGRLEEERDRAQAADHAKTRFLAAASHDLRQPIHALSLLISTLSALAQRGNVSAENASNLASKAKSVTANLGGLLNALLDISRLDAGIITPAKEPVSLNRLFGDLRNEFSGVAKERGLEWRVVDSTLWVDSDPMMLKRILDNFLANAFRYTRQGTVLLGCRRRRGSIEIQVLDTGIGIPADQTEAIFGEFFQLHNPARDREKGLGLGLSIVQRTAQLLGHPVALASTLGRGSVFSIAVSRVAVPSALPTVVRANGSGLGIIVVDDERPVLEAITQLLTVWGHRVYPGRSADEARRAHAAAEGPVNLMIVDYRLEDNVVGPEAVRDLSLYLKHSVPVIILTGDTSPSRLKEAAASGYRLLHKPIDGDRLQEAINEICNE
jgi:signal transduction histidine kinase/CheY-like chemotaxis protein